MSTVEGEAHVYRGGSWYYDREELLRSCVRSMEGTWVVRAFRGFRTFRRLREPVR